MDITIVHSHLPGITPQLDITAPEHGVEITTSLDNKVIWVSVDGQTVLRVCRIPRLFIDDMERIK